MQFYLEFSFDSLKFVSSDNYILSLYWGQLHAYLVLHHDVSHTTALFTASEVKIISDSESTATLVGLFS